MHLQGAGCTDMLFPVLPSGFLLLFGAIVGCDACWCPTVLLWEPGPGVPEACGVAEGGKEVQAFRVIQDVPRTADHAASRTFYTWRVDETAVQARMESEALLAACKLRARFQHEYRVHAEVRALSTSCRPSLMHRGRPLAHAS